MDFLSAQQARAFVHRVAGVLKCPCMRYDNLVHIISTPEEVYEVERIGHTMGGVTVQRLDSNTGHWLKLPANDKSE